MRPLVEAPELRHRRIDVGGLELHVAEAGPEGGPLVILLHGFPEPWLAWRHQIAPLAEAGFRVLAPDQRGYNLSDKPRGLAAYRLDRLVDDVVALVDEAGRERAAVVGHDWGAMVAWWAAVTRPGRVDRLAVLNVPHPAVMRRHLLANRAQRRRSWYVFFFQLPWLPELWYRRHDFEIGVRSVRGSARPGTFDDETMAAYKEAWRQPGALRGMIHWYRAALRRPPKRVADVRVTVPTLVLWGLRDRFLGREMIEPSAALCDEARVELFPEATHWLQHEEPVRVNELLLEHLAAGGPGTRPGGNRDPGEGGA